MRWGSFIDFLHAISPLPRTCTKIGEDVLAKFIYMFWKNYSHGNWLEREQHLIDNAKIWFPLYSKKIVETIQRKEGKGSKLAKIHLLQHFVDVQIVSLVELVKTLWNQMWRILLEEQGTKMIKNTSFFSNSMKVFVLLVKLYWTLEVHLKKLQCLRTNMKNCTPD